MEIQLILGENSSGKSLYAEKLASELSSSPVYIATMVPCTEDNLARIEKHRKQRQDKNFTVYEVPFRLSDISVTANDVVLLEDVSNLLANGIFRYSKTADDAFEEILAVARKCRTLICVNISGLSADGYRTAGHPIVCGAVSAFCAGHQLRILHGYGFCGGDGWDRCDPLYQPAWNRRGKCRCGCAVRCGDAVRKAGGYLGAALFGFSVR